MNPEHAGTVIDSYIADLARKDYECRVLKAELEGARSRIAELEAEAAETGDTEPDSV